MNHYSSKQKRQKKAILFLPQTASLLCSRKQELVSLSSVRPVRVWLLGWNDLFSLALTSCCQFVLNSGVCRWPTNTAGLIPKEQCNTHLVLTSSKGRKQDPSPVNAATESGAQALAWETLQMVFGRPGRTDILPGLSGQRKSFLCGSVGFPSYNAICIDFN